MSSPVSRRPSEQFMPPPPAMQPLPKEALAVENKENQESPNLEAQFDILVRNYYRTITLAEGDPNVVRGLIMDDYRALTKFLEDHPECKGKMPPLYVAGDCSIL